MASSQHEKVTSNLVSSVDDMKTVIDILLSLPTDPPSIFIDLEGVNLSRTGSISIISLFAHNKHHIYLIDVHTLGKAALSTPGGNGKTLTNILESPTIPKVFFDVRNDSDALYAHFQVALRGVQDVQLMENASRPGNIQRKRLVSGLAKCIEMEGRMTLLEKQGWKIVKDKGSKLFDPTQGGSYEIFNIRPMTDDIRLYCVQDVQYLPDLRAFYWGRLTPEWKTKVVDETRLRVLTYQMPTYQPHGSHKALSPWQNAQPAATTLGNLWNQDLLFEGDFEDNLAWDSEDYDDWPDNDNDFEDWRRAPWQGPPS